MSENQLLELLKTSMGKFEEKLDIISKDLNEFKNGISVIVTNFSNRLENTENKVKNIENSMNKTIKERFLDMCINGLVYSFSACLGIFVFLMVFKMSGSNIFTILKSLLGAFVGV